MFPEERAAQQDDHYRRGLELYRARRYAEALAEFEQLTNPAPLTGQMAVFYRGLSHRAIGLGALRDGRFDLAEQHMRAAMGLIGRQADLSVFLAALYAKTNRHDRCATQMERAAEARPDSVAVCRDLAGALWRSGRRAEAYMTLTAGIRRLGRDARLHSQTGLFHASEERFEEARRCFAAAAEADCTSADAWYYLGLADAAAGDVRAAVRSFQRAFELRSDDLMLAYQLSLAARAAQEAGVPVHVHLPEPRTVPGVSRAGDLARFITTDGDFIEAFLDLPESEVDPEVFQTLLAALKTALAEHPDYADLRLHCCRVLRRLGRPEEAAEHAERAVRINGRYAAALVELAQLYSQRGRMTEAIECLMRAIENGADWPDVHCLAGELMLRCDRREQARQHLERALQLKADYARAAKAYASLAA